MASRRDMLMQFLQSGLQQGGQMAQQSAEQEAALARLIKGKEIEGQQSEKDIRLKAQVDRENSSAVQQKAIEQAMALRERLGKQNPGHKYNIGLNAQGGVNISESEPDPTRAMAAQAMMEDKKRRAIQDIEDRVTKANLPNATETLRRTNEATGGVLTDPNVTLKSVGGWKNLIPGIAVPLAESVGAFPEGSQQERTALKDLSNTKVFDSSGKQTNEQEIRRLNEAQGLNGVFNQNAIKDSLNQYANTVMQRQNQVIAGANPADIETYRGRGGLAGYRNLKELLQGSVPQTGMAAQAPAAPVPGAANAAPPQRVVLKQLRNKTTGQVKTIYSDGSEEIK